MKTNKKLIEVALPLAAINIASAREKSIRHGHPSTMHLWWARRPLAAARAVIFAQMVDDPSSHPERFPSEKAQEQEKKAHDATWNRQGTLYHGIQKTCGELTCEIDRIIGTGSDAQ